MSHKSKEDIFNIIVHNLLEILPYLDTSTIALEQSMKDLGANSIDRADVLLSSMETLDLMFPLHEAGDLKNIGELVDFLHAKAQ
ncbi:acyl carrier protein [Dickeya solani]|uniref:Acyl carrier protein n=3 Tax=Dickeya solani TaxID=1089444 RepID=A0AAP1TNZ0_9GAMM|nr:acyl carrier protein [Dickeya solani]ANE74999.1 acyl carrier protein [Dickeya solani IPO 2222]AUH09586.1 acyl carrier protein [Dickeya solani D s0432-1]AUH13548.1 acyl carrier protein [Dickeya solani]AYQ49529.1 Polyketide biosynthesis acyl-carrier-protein AcpK [Dickeya solani]AYQ53693.1 Polyketide biosynthesis acyl-carrier-protein AcpK [Dickeya solani]